MKFLPVISDTVEMTALISASLRFSVIASALARTPITISPTPNSKASHFGLRASHVTAEQGKRRLEPVLIRLTIVLFSS
jgi:hypothetical protein